MNANEHEHHKGFSPLNWKLIGGLGALTLAPYVLPIFGLGSPQDAGNMMGFISTSATQNPYGSGIAGFLQEGLSHLPLIGSTLTSAAPVTIPGLGITMATGAIASLAATTVIGIGGIMLANWMEKRENPNARGIHWSKVIRVAALTTSALIALPGMLTAISVGITFIGSLLGAGNGAAMAMQSSIGATSLHASGAVSGLTAMLPHLFTCGLSAMPILGALFMNGHNNHTKPAPQISQTQHMGQASAMAHAHAV
jgi:hypothetical protein